MSILDLDRPLSPSERAFWHMDAGAPLACCLMARISGGLDESVLRAALDAVQARHPPLRTRVEEVAGELRFCSAGVGPIPLEQERGPEAAWIPRVEHELARRYPVSGPLMRVILRRHDDNAADTLLIAHHHLIGDGLGSVFLLRDILQAVARLAAGEDPDLTPLAPMPPMEDRLPAAARGLRGTWRNGLFMARTTLAAARNGTPLPVRQERHVPAHSRRSRIQPVVLDRQATLRLTTRCHTEGTTVYGALAAAMILGILADQTIAWKEAVRPPNIGFGIPVDMRTRLDPPVDESLGAFVSMLSFEKRLSASMDLWHLARDIRACIVAGRRRRDDFSAMAMSPRLARWLGAERLPPKEFIESWEKHVCGTGGLTNMGRVDIPTTYGGLTLETCHHAVTPSALGQFTACVTSLDGQLFWNFIWPDPCMTEAHADALVSGIVATLQLSLAE